VRSGSWLSACFLLCFAASTFASPHAADARPAERPPSADEQKAFAEGVRLMQAGDAAGAARAFQSGYDAGHDPAFLVRLGEAQEKAGAPAAAAASYRRYVSESADAADAEDIAARAQRLAPVSPAPTAAQPAASASASTPAATAVPPAHPADAAAGSAAVSPPAPAPSASVTTAPVPAAVPKVDEEESLRAFRDENPAPRSRLNVAAWVGTGVTVALLGVAAFYGAKAGEKAGDVDRLTSNFDPNTDLPSEYAGVADRYKAAVRDGKHDERVAKGFAIAAGATALTSAALFIIDAVRKPDDAGGKPHASLAPLVTASSAGLAVGGSF